MEKFQEQYQVSNPESHHLRPRSEVGERGIYTAINRGYLFGTQLPAIYSGSKRKRVERLLSEQGVRFLQENPIITCAVPLIDHTAILILDGHHRVRYSGKFNITYIPSILLSIEEWADFTHKRFGFPKDALNDLVNSMEAQNAFNGMMPLNKPWPIMFPGIWHPSELFKVVPNVNTRNLLSFVFSSPPF